MLLNFYSGSSQSRKEAQQNTQNWRYEIEGVGEGKEGTYLVKIWSYSKNPRIAIEQAKKNAVHAIIFQGFIGVNRVASQPIDSILMAGCLLLPAHWPRGIPTASHPRSSCSPAGSTTTDIGSMIQTPKNG
jgi:hypothetical protein